MRWVVTIIILVAGLFAALMAAGHALLVQETRALMATGTPTEGTVTEQLGTRGSNAKYYSYAYQAGGRRQTATRRDIPWAAREIAIGAKVPVRYDPAKPERSITPAELEEAEGWGNRALFPLLAAGLLGWGIVRIVRARKKPAT